MVRGAPAKKHVAGALLPVLARALAWSDRRCTGRSARATSLLARRKRACRERGESSGLRSANAHAVFFFAVFFAAFFFGAKTR
jgi:hypothetical protein